MKIPEKDKIPFRRALLDIVEKNWKQQQGVLAEKAKISGGYLSEILSAKKTPSKKVALNIVKACKLSYKEFINHGNFLIGNTLCQETPSSLEKQKKEPPVGNVIRVYNNILKETGLKLDPEGEEKLFNLIKRKLIENSIKEVETDIVDILSLSRKAR